ncbi:MAG: Ig-like domain-containing protein [Verrucomicrobiales bacterium]|nr:Ig-like domain-containing protein [Verrucomicrobiales bacterium]
MNPAKPMCTAPRTIARVLGRTCPAWLASLVLGAAWLSVPLSSSAQDSVRPTLAGSSPPNGASGVDPMTPVRFTFSEPMKPQQQILWISAPAPIASNAVTYAWSTDGRELAASLANGWPPNQRINWLFQPGFPALPGISPGVPSFEDLAGNRLAGGAGSFTTSAGGPPPIVLSTNSCGLVSTNLTGTRFAMGLWAHYTQTNDLEAPRPTVSTGGWPFTAFARATPGVGSASAVTLQTPTGVTLPLTHRAGVFARTNGFDSLEAMKTDFPVGTYRFVATGAAGDVPGQVDLRLPNTDLPMIRVANLDFLQGVLGTNDIPILWDPLEGTTTNDTMRIVVSPLATPASTLWSSPDPGCPGAIAPSATSAEIPFSALSRSGGTDFQVEIRFERSLDSDFPGGSARGRVTLGSTTRIRLVRCGASGPSRDRDPRDLPDRCDEATSGASTNALRFVSAQVLDERRLRIVAGNTETGATYQLFELFLEQALTRPGGGGRRGDPVTTPVGGPKIAAGTNVEFEVIVEPAPGSRFFGVGRTGGRR